MGCISFVGAAATWYGAAVKKSYASERDFGHLRQSYASLSENVGHLDRMLDTRMDAIVGEQMKTTATLQALIVRLSGESSQVFKQ